MSSTMTELSPNAEMTLAMSITAPESFTTLSASMQSLDMNPTADDAYDQAVISAAHRMGVFNGDPSSSSSGAMVSSASVGINHHEDFLRLLTRFHQAVTPLPKSITMSFSPPSSSSKPSGFPPRSKVYYCPTRSYSRPNSSTASGMSLARRRTSSAPDLVSQRVTIPLVFNDMESLLSKANEMVDVMRSDIEDTMQRHRNRDRKARERERIQSRSLSVIDEDEDEVDDAPLLRKVPVSTQPCTYLPITPNPHH